MSVQNTNLPRDTLSQPTKDISLWFPVLKTRQSAPLRLICFPYAGGGTPVFRAWPDALTEKVELHVAQLPGRGPRLREKPFTGMEMLVEILTEKLRPLLNRPVAFFGHSLGALIAFETALSLRKYGLSPEHLFVSGSIAPQLPDPAPPIHGLPDDDFLRELNELNGMPQAVLDSKELLEILLPVVRSDFTLLETYKYSTQPPLDCPITAFGGTRDPRTTQSGLEAWHAQTTGSFDLVMLQGDHFFIDTERPILLDAIARRLLKADSMLDDLKPLS